MYIYKQTHKSHRALLDIYVQVLPLIAMNALLYSGVDVPNKRNQAQELLRFIQQFTRRKHIMNVSFRPLIQLENEIRFKYN